MKVRYIGDYYKVSLEKGKVYDVIGRSSNTGWYEIIDETEEAYCFPTEEFEIVEEDNSKE